MVIFSSGFERTALRTACWDPASWGDKANPLTQKSVRTKRAIRAIRGLLISRRKDTRGCAIIGAKRDVFESVIGDRRFVRKKICISNCGNRFLLTKVSYEDRAALSCRLELNLEIVLWRDQNFGSQDSQTRS